MSVLVGTPAYGGQVTVPYLQSILRIRDAYPESVDFLVTSGESHVTRARNNICATFLNRTDYNHLLFIDADIEISAEDFGKLAAMDGVRGAAVACKTPDYSEYLSIYAEDGQITRRSMPQEPFRADFLGSAVLAISRTVFEALIDSDKVTEYSDPIIGRAWDFFRDGVIGDFWASEDYGFCRLCRDAGIDIVCDPSIIVSHYGVAAWRF